MTRNQSACFRQLMDLGLKRDEVFLQHGPRGLWRFVIDLMPRQEDCIFDRVVDERGVMDRRMVRG